MRVLTAMLLLITFRSVQALTVINAIIPENQYYPLGAHSHLEEEVGLGKFPRKSYEIQYIGTNTFKLQTSTNPDFNIGKYNTIVFNGTLEFLAYDKTTDKYQVKITLSSGVSFSNFDPTNPKASLQFKNAKILFADNYKPSKIIIGTLTRKVDADGRPIIENKSESPFNLSLATKRQELLLTTTSQIPVIIEQTT